jgi:hypothetical protein
MFLVLHGDIFDDQEFFPAVVACGPSAIAGHAQGRECRGLAAAMWARQHLI